MIGSCLEHSLALPEAYLPTKAAKSESEIPNHVAIVMDGNRRWAKKRCMPAFIGHWKGAEVISDIVRTASKAGVKVLTLYAFSTENWNRSNDEVSELMKIFAHFLRKNLHFMLEEGVRLECIGDLSKIPAWLQEIFAATKQATKEGKVIDLVLAINYGGRDEIRRAVVTIIDDIEKGLVKKEQISESLIGSYLDTAPWRDPDLFIRTSGEQRLSNFLLWQLSYTEVYITETLWPDFGEEHFMHAISEYKKRQRRHGGQ